EQFGSLAKAFERYGGKRALLVSFDTDWLFPVKDCERVHAAMKEAHVEVTHLVIQTPNGHDAFLVDYDLITPPVRAFLDGV
nr:homoserine O-acetyltransferase [Deltaproteobacteria bacterium]